MNESNAVRANTMFGDYDIIETVGQGGMGIVYRATDTNLNREVALKVLKDDLREHSAIVARFQREAEAYATLNHPNIVHIYSVGAVGQIPYIAMQMIHGMPLSTLMKKERRIEWKRALHIGIQVAEALGSAHTAHIIHRDIKPGNVLVTDDGHAYVTDFGIAKVLTAETQLTVEGSRLGTPQYMSPERCKNEEVSAESDLYSLGVLLFQMITGRLPYESKDPVELVRKIVSDPPQRMRDFLPDVPEDVERLIAFLIEKKTENRPRSAEEWTLLCQRVLDGKPMIEDDSGLEESLRHFRESQGTSTPTPIGQPFNPEKKAGVAKKVQERFRGMSANAITAVGISAVLILGGLAGLFAATSGRPDSVPRLATTLGNIDTDWRDAGALIQFRNEMPGVTLMELGNPNWQPLPAASSARSGMLVFLQGSSESDWSARTGAMWVDAESRISSLTIPPMPVGTMRFVGTRPSDDAPLVDVGEEWYALSPTPGDSPVRESAYSILGKTANESLTDVSRIQWDDDHAVVVARDVALGETGIFRFIPGERVGTSLVGPRGDIGKIRVVTGEAIFWSETTGNGTWSLYGLDRNDTDAGPLRLIEQIPSPESFDTQENTEALCAIRVNSDGTQDAITLNLESLSLPTRIAEGTDVRWLPSPDRKLALLVPDRKGVNQVWIVEGVDSPESKQVTFLEDGVSDLGVVVGNRLIAISGSTTQPALIEINLEQLR